MRVFVPRLLAVAICSLAAVLSGRVLAQAGTAQGAAAAEPPDEVTVRGRKSEAEFRLELERQRDEIFRIFNAVNKGDDTDIRCREERPTGRRIPQTVCRSSAEDRAHAKSGEEFLRALFFSSGGWMAWGQRTGSPTTPGDTVLNANIGTGRAQQDGVTGEKSALEQWEVEWKRLLTENRDLYTAVVKYAEIENEYAQARGDTVAALPDLLRGAPPEAQPAGPQCEASTLTEYSQRNNLALVSGTVSISNCPAGTTGSFTLVARLKNDADETKTLEFDETWQRADATDHKFETQYPIGENVFLQSVRVRNLTCSCAEAAQ